MIAVYIRDGMGMKVHIWVGYRVSNKFQVRVGSGTGPRKTLPENTCITGEVIHRHNSFEIRVNYNIKFFMATRFYSIFKHMTSFQSINIGLEVGKYHSRPNTLPFWVGYLGANTRTPGRIKVPVLSLA